MVIKQILSFLKENYYYCNICCFKVVFNCGFFLFVFRFYLFIFREKGREGEREGEKHQCVVASHVAPTGNLAYNPGMCPDWNQTGNPLVHRPTQSTGPHQPGLIMVLIFITLMTNNAEHLFMHLLVIYIFSLEKFLFKSFARF